MLVGHAAVALAGKRLEPNLSLGTLMAATFLADLLGIVLILLGIEHWTLKPGGTGVNAVDLDSIAWSHGLVPDLFGRGCWLRATSSGVAGSREPGSSLLPC